MKNSRRRKTAGHGPGLDISSLIDVSFLLLIFFLVASTIQRSEADLNTVFATDQPSQPVADPYEIDIRLHTDGRISVDGEVVEPATDSRRVPNLKNRLAEVNQLTDLADFEEKLAIIVADDNARHQRFVDILNALTEARITNITISGFSDS